MKKVKLTSIKYKMIFVSLFIGSFVAIALMVMTYFKSSDKLTRLSIEHYEKNVNDYSFIIGTWFAEKINEVSMYSRVHAVKNKDYKQATIYLKKELSNYNCTYKNFFISDVNGKCRSFISANHKYDSVKGIQDISNKDYFIRAVNGEVVITSSLVSKIDGKKQIVIASPIKDNDRIVGVLCGVISLRNLEKILEYLNTNADLTKIMIIDQDGLILIHSNSIDNMKYNIFEQSKDVSKELEEASHEIISGKSGYINVKDNKELYYYSLIPSTDYKILFQASKDLIYKPAINMTNELVIIGLIGIIVTVLMSKFISNSISNPMIQLNNVIYKASLGDMSVRAEINTNDEIGQAAKGFNNMMDKIGEMTYYDHLTALPNKRFFNEALSNIYYNSSEANNAAVLLVGIDKLKSYYDTYGITFGDELLKQIAHQLKETANSKYMMARVSEEEFAVLLKNVINEDQIIKFAKNILGVLNKVWISDNKKLYINSNIGISYKCSDKLLEYARIAMHFSRENGSCGYEFYKEKMNSILSDRVNTENSILSGIENGEFYLEFQPIIDVENHQMMGVEALTRWKSSHKGLIKPDEFIPLAEKNGTIIQLGEWILRNACIQNMKWAKKLNEPIMISVNISIIQLRQLDFINRVKNILRETGMDPKYLELEITESILVCNDDYIAKALLALRELGISVALDDFGTGYSSLSYLNKFNFNTLKIDKSFISNLSDNTNNKALITSILDIAHNLNINVTAEGVETEEQLNFLKLKNCDKIQGYYFSPPTHADDIYQLIIHNYT
ncbi:EAL domain-containing protein [Clostridiaceae bacterium M8S5]|nr:EAL domain-containing protein [Clostridiaceae bacterium M8S5]